MIAVVVAALALRIGFVVETHVPDPIRADAAHYAQYARNLQEHGTFSLDPGPHPKSDSFRSPGYPVFVLLHRLAVGDAKMYDAVRLSQAVLDSVSVLLAFLLARRLLPFGGALAVATLTALSPHLVANTGYLLTETLTTFALALALLALLRVLSGGDRGVVCGLAFVVATLTNEALTPLPYVLAWLAWRRLPGASGANVRRALRVVVVLCALAHVGWGVRNAVAVGPDAPRGSSRALQTLSHGTYPDFIFADPRFRYMPYRDDPEQPRYGEDLGHFARVFAARVAERPLRYASWYALEKPFYVWGFDGLQATRDIYTYEPSQALYERHAVAGVTLTLMRWLHWPLVAVAGIGLVVLRRRRRDREAQTLQMAMLGACLLFGTLLGTVFAPWPRYVIPMRPALFVVAVFGALAIWKAAVGRLQRPAQSLSNNLLSL